MCDFWFLRNPLEAHCSLENVIDNPRNLVHPAGGVSPKKLIWVLLWSVKLARLSLCFLSLCST